MLKLLAEMEKLVRLVDYNLTTTTSTRRWREAYRKEGKQPWNRTGNNMLYFSIPNEFE